MLRININFAPNPEDPSTEFKNDKYFSAFYCI